jgi:hypothetical protein
MLRATPLLAAASAIFGWMEIKRAADRLLSAKPHILLTFYAFWTRSARY